MGNAVEIKKGTKFYELYKVLSEKSNALCWYLLSFKNQSFKNEELFDFITRLESQSVLFDAKYDVKVTPPDENTIDVVIKITATLENVLKAHLQHANLSVMTLGNAIHFLKEAGMELSANTLEYRVSFVKDDSVRGGAKKQGSFSSFDGILNWFLSSKLIDVIGENEFRKFRTKLLIEKLTDKDVKWIYNNPNTREDKLSPFGHYVRANTMVNSIPLIKACFSINTSSDDIVPYNLVYLPTRKIANNISLSDFFCKKEEICKHQFQQHFTFDISKDGDLNINFTNLDPSVVNEVVIRELQDYSQNIYLVCISRKSPLYNTHADEYEDLEAYEIRTCYLTENALTELSNEIFKQDEERQYDNYCGWFVTSISLLPPFLKDKLFKSNSDKPILLIENKSQFENYLF